MTNAPVEAALAAFPRGVPTAPGILALPSARGTVDLITEQTLDGVPDPFGFSLQAIAWDLQNDELIDPLNGVEDLRRGNLRTLGDPVTTLERSPLLALRALRLVGELGVHPDSALVAALPTTALAPRPRLWRHGRTEIARALCSPGASDALELANVSGLASTLAPGADPDLGRWIDSLPVQAELRFAVWLGASAESWLRAWRYHRSLTDRVIGLARYHPIDEAARPRHDPSISRLLGRLSPEDRHTLEVARNAQLASGTLPSTAVTEAREKLAALRKAIDRVERNQRFTEARGALALSGDQVIERLGWPPGPEIGSALRYLTGLVAVEPERNTPEQLEAALEEWARARSRE
jgi:tRNA nucleotidyltransferase/poly(A) polymerase